ncbi:hypothetical protein HRbin27_00891 [bacterium HR27]|nr:hypothetical protein HRbin27_00891 [bacterium HR27]
MNTTLRTISRRRSPVQAAGWGAAVGVVGGLLGLGGAEFRIPILVRFFRYDPRAAVPLNLSVTLVTLVFALLVRARVLSLEPVLVHGSVIEGMVVGSVLAALVGPRLLYRLRDTSVRRLLVGLLVFLGVVLVVEAFLPAFPSPLPEATAWRVLVAAFCGAAIGLIASLLGVAGGELIIPTLVVLFGLDVKAAGTASPLISIPTVLVGLWGYRRLGAFQVREPLRWTVLPMAIGSIAGAFVGGWLARFVPGTALKVFLGILLIVSAVRALGKES